MTALDGDRLQRSGGTCQCTAPRSLLGHGLRHPHLADLVVAPGRPVPQRREPADDVADSRGSVSTLHRMTATATWRVPAGGDLPSP